MSRGRRLNRLWAVLAAGLIIDLAIIHWATGWSGLRLLRRMSGGLFAAGLLLACLPTVTNAWRVGIWSRRLGRPISPGRALRLVWATDLTAAITPTALGGAPAKIALLVQAGVSPGAAATLCLVGTLEDAFPFLVLIPIGLWRQMRAPGGLEAIACFRDLPAQVHVWCSSLPFGPILAGLVAFGVAGFWLCRRRWACWRTRLREFHGQMDQAWSAIRGRERSAFLRTLPLSALQWIARYSIASLILYALGCPLDPLLGIVLQWLTFTTMAFFPSPGAIGGAEGAFYAIYSGVVPGAALGAVLISWRVLTFYVPMLTASIGTLGAEWWSSSRKRRSRASTWTWGSSSRTAREEV